MIKIASIPAFWFVALVLPAFPAFGQAPPITVAPPTYQGFELPQVGGTLTYSLSASERVALGYDGTNSTASYADFSGDVALLTDSVARPFSLVYTGGYLLNTTNQPSSFFSNLSLSQVFNTRVWNFVFSDNLMYLPISPTSGLSGIPGLGDLGVPPPTEAGEDILSNYAQRIQNSASAGVQRKLTGNTSVGGTGSMSLLRFESNSANDGVDSNDYSGIADISHRIDARNTASANYTYSRFVYLVLDEPLTVQGVNFEYNRIWTRKVTSDISIGPEITGASALTGTGTQLNYAVDAKLNYVGEKGGSSVSYVRAVNNGSGFTLGARNNTLTGSIDRSFSQFLHGSASVSYWQSTGLTILTADQFSTHSLVASGQLNRAIGKFLSVYASYTLQRQLTSGYSTSLTPFTGTEQFLAFGLTYSPRAKHFAHQ